jgi:hypothetical protein
MILRNSSLYFLAKEKHLTLAFSCGARSAFKLKERSYLRSTLSRRQLQGFVGCAATDNDAPP